MTQPGMISHGMPPMADDLARRVRDLERAMEVVRGRSIQAVNLAQAAIEQAQTLGFTSSIVQVGANVVDKTVLTATLDKPVGFSRVASFAVAYLTSNLTASGPLDVHAWIIGPSGTSGGGYGADCSSNVQNSSSNCWTSLGSVNDIPGSSASWSVHASTGSGGGSIQAFLSLLAFWQP